MTLELINHFKNKCYDILDLVDLADVYRGKAHQQFKDLDITFLNISPDLTDKDHELIFHIVDKDQRAGGREI